MMSGRVWLEPIISIAEGWLISTLKQLFMVGLGVGLPYLLSRVARLGKIIVSVAVRGAVIDRYWTYRNAG